MDTRVLPLASREYSGVTATSAAPSHSLRVATLLLPRVSRDPHFVILRGRATLGMGGLSEKKSSNRWNLKAGHFMMTTKVVAATVGVARKRVARCGETRVSSGGGGGGRHHLHRHHHYYYRRYHHQGHCLSTTTSVASFPSSLTGPSHVRENGRNGRIERGGGRVRGWKRKRERTRERESDNHPRQDGGGGRDLN